MPGTTSVRTHSSNHIVIANDEEDLCYMRIRKLLESYTEQRLKVDLEKNRLEEEGKEPIAYWTVSVLSHVDNFVILEEIHSSVNHPEIHKM